MLDKRNKIKDGNGIISTILIYFLMIFIVIITIYPFLNVLAISFNDAMDSIKGGIYLWPRVFTLKNYREVFSQQNLLTAFKNSVIRTVIGSILGIISTMMVAYVLSRKDFIFRKIVSILFVITMYVDGGMIPSYILIKKLGLMNRFAVYIIPGLIGIFYIFVLRSFIEGLPYSLQESAQIDGANDLTIFFKIIMPLCMPAIAVVGLYYAVMHWNSWFDTYLFAGRNKALTTLQYELMKVLNASNAAAVSKILKVKHSLKPGTVVTPEAIRMAITIVATVPILVVYPFLQKYFVKGLTLGAVKS